MLGQDHVIEGVSYIQGEVIGLHPGGKRLRYLRLSTDRNIRGIPFPAGTEIYFNEDGSWSLTLIQGIPFDRNGVLEFHENGRLKMANLGTDFSIEGIVLPQGTRLWLNENGYLDAAMLLKAGVPVPIGGSSFERGGLIHFDGTGKGLKTP